MANLRGRVERQGSSIKDKGVRAAMLNAPTSVKVADCRVRFLTGFMALSDMCHDPNHLLLWFQIQIKIRKKSLISVVAYGAYIPLSRPSQFCLLPNPNFQKMPKILRILRSSESKIRAGFCRFSWGSSYFIKEVPCHIPHYNMDNQAQYSKVP